MGDVGGGVHPLLNPGAAGGLSINHIYRLRARRLHTCKYL